MKTKYQSVLYHVIITIFFLALFSCRDNNVVEPPIDNPIVDSSKFILSYYPLNIGDVKYYNSNKNIGWTELEYYQTKHTIHTDTTLANGIKYYKNVLEFFYQDSTKNSAGSGYYRIDTSSFILYSYSISKKKRKYFYR